MPNQFEEIGSRLRAYRMGKNLSADDIAAHLGISRAAVYRLEKGEIVKIQILESISKFLDVSLPSLLGVGVEYYSNALSFFERMRQLEEKSLHLLGNFSPVSSLLLSPDYMDYLRLMLIEAISGTVADREAEIARIDKILDLLRERRASVIRRRVPVVSIVGSQDIERFLLLGMVGRFDLPPEVVAERRAAARAEIERLCETMERQPIGTQIGIVDGQPPSQTFQIYEREDDSAVTLSPYRLGDQPNISSGIAIVTSAPEAVRHFKETLDAQWALARKGVDGAEMLRRILDRTGSIAA
ncbi:helix-turn-helix transcriptional regulator [Pelagibacterium sp. H642]|uniref:helix-turn-helix domain-containing protein n=1 Tax=Pelagibacterium sp. H642 TaxID=1881069 RepID=UPI0028167F96|nr:helix-turn-helix transcriptional regulator [Pelagibacterium sp. H642]WMT90858.1 helix-turn-helix transcriptional regulator [Pelagibacterium sp. H642]